MRERRKKRLVVVCLIVVGVGTAVGLTLMALKQNINLFFSPSQIAAGEAPENTLFRIGGMVVNGSVNRNKSDLNVTFELTDTAQNVTVSYAGILPDLFREGQGIVALGKMDANIFIAEQVLAKHDENYMPPEVSDALKAANKGQYNVGSDGLTN